MERKGERNRMKTGYLRKENMKDHIGKQMMEG